MNAPFDMYGRVLPEDEKTPAQAPEGWVSAEVRVDKHPRERGLHWFVPVGVQVGDHVVVGFGVGKSRHWAGDRIALESGVVVAFDTVPATRFAVASCAWVSTLTPSTALPGIEGWTK